MLHSSERIIKHKLGLLNLAEELGNVSRACKVMGLSRDTFYRYRNAVEAGGIEAPAGGRPPSPEPQEPGSAGNRGGGSSVCH